MILFNTLAKLQCKHLAHFDVDYATCKSPQVPIAPTHQTVVVFLEQTKEAMV